MMSGYTSLDPTAPRPHRRIYRVLRRKGGWSVAAGGCLTRPLSDHDAAQRLARRLQIQWDHLNHAPIDLTPPMQTGD